MCWSSYFVDDVGHNDDEDGVEKYDGDDDIVFPSLSCILNDNDSTSDDGNSEMANCFSNIAMDLRIL